MSENETYQICQLLKAMVRTSNTEPRTTADKVYGNLATKALALLPCETCNGSGVKIEKGGHKYCRIKFCSTFHCGPCGNYIPLKPCKRCGGTNGVHKQVDDPQAGNSHMLTKMQCPLDK